PPASWDVKAERAKGLYLADKEYPLKSVEQNPVIQEWMKIMGDKHAEHEYWHIHYASHGGHH
ncbi:MAG: iron hydrogenase small subunit, partial [Treponema sp.]|nr:iron hydrogenase small subunit [Treponema sp.]